MCIRWATYCDIKQKNASDMTISDIHCVQIAVRKQQLYLFVICNMHGEQLKS